MMCVRNAAFGALLAALASCQTPGSVPQPAVLESASPEMIAKLKSIVAEATGKARVEFGPGDLTRSSVIAVLPPKPGPFDTHSVAIPTYFDLVVLNGQCALIERESRTAHMADDVNCKPL